MTIEEERQEARKRLIASLSERVGEQEANRLVDELDAKLAVVVAQFEKILAGADKRVN